MDKSEKFVLDLFLVVVLASFLYSVRFFYSWTALCLTIILIAAIVGWLLFRFKRSELFALNGDPENLQRQRIIVCKYEDYLLVGKFSGRLPVAITRTEVEWSMYRDRFIAENFGRGTKYSINVMHLDNDANREYVLITVDMRAFLDINADTFELNHGWRWVRIGHEAIGAENVHPLALHVMRKIRLIEQNAVMSSMLDQGNIILNQ
jgi:hypothetical protein